MQTLSFYPCRRLRGFSLPELLVVLVIIGILVLIALPNLMPLISRAKATEAQQQLTYLHTLQRSNFYTYSRYSSSLDELGFEQSRLVTDGGQANYLVEIVEASEHGFRATATAVVDFDGDGVYNVWETDQDKTLRETVKDGPAAAGQGICLQPPSYAAIPYCRIPSNDPPMFPAPYPSLLLFLPAAVLARDDFRTRRVDASWLAVLGTVSVGVSWHTLGWRAMLLQTAGNAALLLLSGTALFGYLRLRRLSVRHAFGAGDVLFLLAVAPLFAPTEFLWFLIAACVVALLWWVCCGRRRRTIPFVGAAGIVLIGCAALQFLRLWL